ncbi:cystathionine gamma-synthase family protein [Novibacillus thermophilus]|uniref:homocysteine desulfhydrase n=1 Tax=Novibacillus thermophilus TaxID=1471761 RepID=A0A1U9K9X5_9BACL|nr:cystathionine gamma-synthase family protein [Novibacillus thermophilus]AQS56793.1 cystathionine gamma-synthase [Novibacillus thermophilus]
MTTYNSDQSARVGTQTVWGGEDEYLMQGATQVPVVHSVSYGYDDIDVWQDVALGKRPGHIYGRMSNPTVRVFEEKVRLLEGAEDACSFATGMAAISSTLFAFLSPGDRVVTIKDTYGGTNKIFIETLPRFNVDVALCDTTDHDMIEREIAKGCQLLYLESPTNPTMKVTDLERLAKAAHAAQALVVVDNTFATPINQLPLSLGADLVIHSATKYLGGHADALAGVVCGSHKLVKEVYHFREIHGAALDPMAAYLMLRGMKTLHLRVRQQNENAMHIAQFLEEQPLVEDVFYPGLASHDGHEIAKKQMSGFGGMLSFSLKGGIDSVRVFLPKLKYAHLAANLGAVETIAAPPRTSSHVENTLEERQAMGIPEGLIRYSVGIEDADDLIDDLKQALEHLETNVEVGAAK